MTNSSQSVTASLTLSAFGQAVASTGSSSDPYQYGATSGYRGEGDAGLTRVGCRYYDAQVGRFISRDTDLNEAPYVYCEGDPVNMVDEDGHRPQPPKKKKPSPPPDKGEPSAGPTKLVETIAEGVAKVVEATHPTGIGEIRIHYKHKTASGELTEVDAVVAIKIVK